MNPIRARLVVTLAAVLAAPAKIAGKFDADGDSFWTGTDSAASFWYLKGGSNASRVTAGIRCIVKDAF